MSGAEIPGQMTIEPCVVCGEPSTETRVITPSQTDAKGRLKKEVRGRVCPEHAAAIERDMGWKERQAKERSAQRKKMKRLQEASTLFDAPAVGSKFGRETA